MKKDSSNTHSERAAELYGEEELYEEKSLLRKKRKSRFRVFLIFVSLIIAFTLLYFAARAIFKVESIVVEGNQAYSDEVIQKESGINPGDFMFSFASSDVEKRISRGCPYITSVEMHRIYPSSVVITVSETTAQYYTMQMDKYIIFSRDLKVLGVLDNEVSDGTLIYIELPKIAKAIEGGEIEFASLKSDEYIKEFIDAIPELKTEEKIDCADLRESFSIKMRCGGKYQILLGKDEELHVKMRTLTKVIESKTVQNSAAASIDMSNPKEPRVIPYDSIDELK